MSMEWQEQLRPGVALREIVQQATVALIAMDAERLEELARCCRDLNRGLESEMALAAAAGELSECDRDLRLLQRVLYETRANLTVFSRLHAIRIQEAAVAAGRIPEQNRNLAASRAPGLQTSLALDWRERTADYGDN